MVLRPALDDPGELSPVTSPVGTTVVAAGPVGSLWFFATNTGEVWEPVSVSATFTTDANAATRRVVFRGTNGGSSDAFMSGNIITQTANLARRYVFGRDVPTGVAVLVANRVVAVLPRLLLFPSALVVLDAVNIQAGDQFTNIEIVWNQWRVA